MVIVQLSGGLGNQMFQYALYLKLRSLGKEVKIDDISGFAQDAQRIPALSPFGISYERPTAKELRQMLDSSLLPWHRVRRKLFGRHKKSYFEGSKLFMPEVLGWDDIYLEGYWQSEKYFREVKEEVLAAYDTDKLVAYLRQAGIWERAGVSAGERKGKSPGAYAEEINNTCSVSVHVRGGDYLTSENQALFGGNCTKAYYIEGIRRMRERYPGCRFFLFTNDREWATRQEISDSDIEWIALPKDSDNDYAEFVLMSFCKHHILANSSFGWWASYLNKNPDKTVFVPNRWLNGADCSDLYRPDMCKIQI